MVIILSLVLVSPLMSQETLSLQIVNTGEVSSSREFLLVIPLDFLGISFTWEETNLPEGLEFTSRPRLQNTGRSRIESTIRAQSAGRYVIPSLKFFLANTPYQTSSQILEVYTENGEIPPLFRWTGSSHLHLGQTSLYVVSLINSTEFLFPGELEPPQLENGIVDEVFGVVAVYSRKINNKDILNIPIASFLFTPTQVGQNTIPPVRVTMDGRNYLSNAFSVNVLPLPPSVEFNGAVGKFNFTHHLSSDLVSVGESITMSVRVAGTGNLPFINVPEPKSDSVIFVEPVETMDIQATEMGYEGFRELTYQIPVVETGAHRIRIEAFTAIDPDTDLVYQIPGGGYNINAVVENPENQTLRFPLLSAEELNKLRPAFFYSHRLLWIFFLVGPVVALLIWKIPFRNIALLGSVFLLMSLSEAVHIDGDLVAALQEGQYRDQKEMVENLLEADPFHPGLHYLMSVISHATNDMGAEVYHLRQAVRLAPQSAFLHAQLIFSEESLGLSFQVPVDRPLPIDWVFTAGLIYWTLMWISVSILWRCRLQTTIIVAGSLLLVIFLGIAGVFARTEFLLHQTEAVILYNETMLKRIPDADASDWISLPVGTAVKVRGVYKDFYQVTTGHGSEGWVEYDAVRYEGDFAEAISLYK